jgi:hypothetical protein
MRKMAMAMVLAMVQVKEATEMGMSVVGGMATVLVVVDGVV